MTSDLAYRLRLDTDPVLYLGYPLHLSMQERRIVGALADACRDTDDGYVATERLQALCTDGTPESLPCSAGQIAVLVHRINERAAVIGDRRLIISHRGRGYRLNPYM
jgi:hypothetical protein